MTFIVYISRQVNERVIEIGMHVMCNPGYIFMQPLRVDPTDHISFVLTKVLCDVDENTTNNNYKRREQITNHIVLSRTCSQR